MARVTGLEPATSGVTGRHSNQLSYTRAWSKNNASKSGVAYGVDGGMSSIKIASPDLFRHLTQALENSSGLPVA